MFDPVVVIRCYAYNHEPYIEDALKGFVMQQTSFPFCAVVIDDCSTDGTAAIIRRYQSEYPDIIKAIYLTENHFQNGKSKSCYFEPYERNARYVAFCEGDDFWTDPHKLQRQYDALEAHPECSVCFHRVRKVKKNGHRTLSSFPGRLRLKRVSDIDLKGFVDQCFLLGRWTFQTSSFFMRSEMPKLKDELQKIVFKDFPSGDMPLQLTCLMNGQGYLLQDEMSCYRLLSGGYTSQSRLDPSLAIKRLNAYGNGIESLKEYLPGKFDTQFDAYLRQIEVRRHILEAKLSSRHYHLNLGYIKSRIHLALLRLYRGKSIEPEKSTSKTTD